MFAISSQRLRQRLDDNKGARLAASVCPLYAPSISIRSSRFATFLCPLTVLFVVRVFYRPTSFFSAKDFCPLGRFLWEQNLVQKS